MKNQFYKFIKLFIIDDFTLLSQSLKTTFEHTSDTRVVGFCPINLLAIEKIRKAQPHIVLIHVGTKTPDALEIGRKIKSFSKETNIIFWLFKLSEARIFHCL